MLRLITSSNLVDCSARQIGRLGTIEDAIDVTGRAPILVDEIRPVGDQTAVRHEVSIRVDRRQAMPGRRRDDQRAMDRRARAHGR